MNDSNNANIIRDLKNELAELRKSGELRQTRLSQCESDVSVYKVKVKGLIAILDADPKYKETAMSFK